VEDDLGSEQLAKGVDVTLLDGGPEARGGAQHGAHAREPLGDGGAC
jgi:hypothetical protein